MSMDQMIYEKIDFFFAKCQRIIEEFHGKCICITFYNCTLKLQVNC